MKTQNKTTRAIIFDSGTLISFSMSGITDIIKRLRGIFPGKFLITNEIKKEIVDTPIRIKKYELEALKLKELIDTGVLELPESVGISSVEVTRKKDGLMSMANSMFKGENRDIHLIDIGEASCLALGAMLTAKGVDNILAIDERTTRMLVESHENLRIFLEHKLDVRISVNHDNLNFFKGFRVIRSPELLYVAYKKGIVGLKNGDVLDALLYSVKFKGASISDDEIAEIKRLG